MVDFVTTEYDGTVRMWAWDGSSLPHILHKHETEKPCGYHSVAVSVDGRLAVTAHYMCVYLWSMVTGQQIAMLDGFGWSHGVSISTELIAVACSTGKIPLCKYDGTLVRNLEGHSAVVYDVCFSPDGKKLVSGGLGINCIVWDVATGTILNRLKHWYCVTGVSWSSHNNIATASWNDAGHIWDETSGKLIVTLNGHKDRVMSISHSSDNKWIATGSFDGTVRIWKTNGVFERTLIGHCVHTAIWALSFSSDNKWLASASSDNNLRLWDVATGTCLHILPHPSSVVGVAFCRVDRHALQRQQDTMFATAILCDQRETDPFLPREVWSECLKHIFWHDFVPNHI